MPAITQAKILVACPHCGHQQAEPRTAFSTVCKSCRGHFHVQEALNPTPKNEAPPLERRRIVCFDCGAELDVPLAAESTMCKRCSSYVDLHDYHITTAISKNFKTKGIFVVEPKGYVFNSEALVSEAIIRGRFFGKLTVTGSLTIFSSAELKGNFKPGRLIIPAESHFRWKDPIRAGAAEIVGELVADLQVDGPVIVKSTGRLFGNVQAQDLIVEAGALIIGQMQIGVRLSVRLGQQELLEIGAGSRPKNQAV